MKIILWWYKINLKDLIEDFLNNCIIFNWRKGIVFNLKKFKSFLLEDILCYGFGFLKNVNKKSKCWIMLMFLINRNI